MTTKDFVVSADGHIVEPNDLFRTRLPNHLRDRGFWEEDFEVEPLVPGGVREFARVRTPGFEGWTVSRYRHFDGSPHTGDPQRMLQDMDLDGIDAQLMHPNRSLFALYSDDHELSIAHARVYNDYVIERYTPHFGRIAPTAPIPLTDVDDAVAEIERIGAAGFRGVLLPAHSPVPFWSPELEPVWAAARAVGTHVFFHCATGGVKVNDPESTTLKVVKTVDLQTTKTDSADPVPVGQSFFYTITVHNNSTNTATGVKVTDTLKFPLVFESVSASGLTCTGGTKVICKGTLAGGATATITIHVHGTANATVTNVVNAVSGVLDAVSRECPTRAPIVFAGFSQGVAMAFRAAAAATSPIGGVVAAGGDVPPEIPSDRLAAVRAVVLCRGVRDEWYTTEKFTADRQRLTDAGVAVTRPAAPLPGRPARSAACRPSSIMRAFMRGDM